MRVLLRIEGFFELDGVKNVDLRDRLKQEGVLDMMKALAAKGCGNEYQ